MENRLPATATELLMQNRDEDIRALRDRLISDPQIQEQFDAAITKYKLKIKEMAPDKQSRMFIAQVDNLRKAKHALESEKKRIGESRLKFEIVKELVTGIVLATIAFTSLRPAEESVVTEMSDFSKYFMLLVSELVTIALSGLLSEIHRDYSLGQKKDIEQAVVNELTKLNENLPK